ncbi:unnamed protein product, partial [marine sediment metagenome]
LQPEQPSGNQDKQLVSHMWLPIPGEPETLREEPVDETAIMYPRQHVLNQRPQSHL